MPVPEAPMMPMSPRGTTLAKPSGTPPMIAVPQSGPMTRQPESRASRLSATSSLERHIVGEDHDVEPAPQRLARLGGGEVAGHRDQRQVGVGHLLHARRAGCAAARRRRRARRARLIEQAPRLGHARRRPRRASLRPQREDQIAGLGLARRRRRECPPRAGSPCWPACRSSGRLPRRPAARRSAREMRISAIESR